MQDTYQTNKLLHFEEIIRNNGFTLSSEGGVGKLDEDTKAEMKQIVEDKKEELFEEFIEAEDKTLNKFSMIKKRIDLLGLSNVSDEILETYSDIITNKFKLMEHLNIIRLLKSDTYIDIKLLQTYQTGFDVKTIESIFNKIKLLRCLEEKYDIGLLNVACDKVGDIVMDDATFKLFNNLFRSTKKKPTNFKELMQLYFCIIKNITCNEIIISTKCLKRGDGNRDSYSYTLDSDVIHEHLELNKYINANCNGFNNQFVEMFKIDVKKQSDTKAEFIDEVEM